MPLYLLDADLDINCDRLLTGQLYGWFSEERVAQEMILGIGGMQALQALGIKTDILHFNDCHPLFAGLALVRRTMEQKSLSFEEAWQLARKKIVFTTHTPVPAGNEFHNHELLRYMGAAAGFTHGQLLSLGGDPFSMTAAGLRLARKANAVSQLHGKTARRMWQEVTGAAEIIAITNGVHNKTWQDRDIVAALAGDGDLWQAHQRAKCELLSAIKTRTGKALREDVLLIGFGRRATAYKRADLIFHDPRQVEPLLKTGKLQLVFSGKAHPQDKGGKEILRRLLQKARKYDGVVFLENYDMTLGRLLTSGCDVWLNNPIRPLEASGTSGMKAAMNGVLNLSVLDGWWPEACRHGSNGWQIGEGREGGNADDNDAASLYRVLRREVIPTYYKNRKKWLNMMRQSIRSTQEKFSAARMVSEYYDKLYR
jgi:starch phosphorylase